MKKILALFISSLFGCEVVMSQDFTVLVLPDTQFYIVSYSTPGGGGQGKPEMFQHQIDYIKTNVDALNIKFVTHVGDIVDHGERQWEWDLANSYMSQLDGVVPYAIAPGNHDASVMWGHDYPLFNKTFPPSRFKSQPWYGGNFPADNYKNNYELFSASGMDFIIIHLESDPQADARKWASGILDQYPNRRAIITTHWYLEGGISPQGNAIWKDVIDNHPNVFLQLCGHSCAREGMLATTNKSGGTVYQILTDYQCDFNGGNGQLRYYTFHPDKNQIEGFTYSTETKKYGTHFTLDYQMSQPTTPQIKDITKTPANPKSTNEVIISSSISDNGSITSAKLFWGTTSGNLTNQVAMTLSSNIYTAKIPAQSDGSTIYYKISATDNENNTSNSTESSYKVSNETSFTFFDYDGKDMSFTGFGGSDFSKTTNPAKNNINNSDNVGKCVKGNPSETWAGIYSTTLSSKIDFSASSIFKMKVLSPKICNVLLKLESSANAAISKEVQTSTATLNSWEELSFNFRGAASNTFDKITLFFDFGNTTGNTFYFDDLKLSPDVTTAVETISNNQLSVFPNPVNNTLNIENNKNIDEIVIYNFAGMEINRVSDLPGSLKINTSEFEKGIYFLMVKTGDDITFKRFIKE